MKTAVEEPETAQEQAALLLERAREAKSPAVRGQLLTKALQKLAALPAAKPPAATGKALVTHTCICVATSLSFLTRCLLVSQIRKQWPCPGCIRAHV